MLFKNCWGMKTKAHCNEKLLQGEWILIVKKVINPYVDGLNTWGKCIRRYLFLVLIFKLKEFIAKQPSYCYQLKCSEQIEFQLCLPCSSETPCYSEQAPASGTRRENRKPSVLFFQQRGHPAVASQGRDGLERRWEWRDGEYGFAVALMVCQHELLLTRAGSILLENSSIPITKGSYSCTLFMHSAEEKSPCSLWQQYSLQPRGSGWAERRAGWPVSQGWVDVPMQKLFSPEAKLQPSRSDSNPRSAVTQERRQWAHTAAKENRLEHSPY